MARSISRVSETPSIRASPFHITPENFNPKIIMIIRPVIHKGYVIWIRRASVCERTIAVEEKSINGIEEIYGGLRSEALTTEFLCNRRCGDFCGHLHRRDE